MNTCKVCERQFASSTSLTRHAKKHTDPPIYLCSICDVAFHRNDILTRHMRLHNANDGDSEAGHHIGAASPSRVRQTGRKRCHTACSQCRDSKIKCDGQNPCQPCNKSGKICKFPEPSSNRVSRLAHRRQSQHATSSLHGTATSNESRHNDLSIANSGNNHRGSSSGSPEHNDATNFPDHLSPESPTVNITREYEQFTGTEPIDISMATNFGDCGVPSNEDVFPPIQFSPLNGIPWAWMHENNFLSDNCNEGMNSMISDNIGFPLAMFPDTTQNPTDFGPEMSQGVAAQEPLSTEDTNTMEAEPSQPAMQSNTPQQSHVPIASHLSTISNANTAANEAPTGTISSKNQIVESIISYARSSNSQISINSQPEFWQSASSQLCKAFGLDTSYSSSPPATTPALEKFVQLYLDDFHPLWPLVSRQNLKIGNLHPLLFLAMSGIGAMYGGPSTCEFGVMLHGALCECLTLPLEFQLGTGADELLWLGQARLLTQVAALYFGQTKAFSYAQHLGVLLVAQARKFNLFGPEYCTKRMETFRSANEKLAPDQRLSIWLEVEMRRRLAFGIFRGDTFTSIILNTKPIVTLDEIDLEFPTCEEVWGGPKISTTLALEMIDHHCQMTAKLRASDLYHILMESDEALPPLEPLAHELLLFGLQYPLWRFSHDDSLLQRLTGRSDSADLYKSCSDQEDAAPRHTRRETGLSEAELLDALSRQMNDLINDRDRLFHALKKWEKALPIVKTLVRNERDRSFILSGLILYHLGYIRLLAPIESLHQVQYRMAERQPVSATQIREIVEWTALPQARLSVSRVQSTWNLLTRESSMTGSHRSRVNLLAFVGLHHGAALLWAFVGCRKEKKLSQWLSEMGFELSRFVPLADQGDGKEDLNLFKILSAIYERISLAGWSSFIEASRVLAKEFPTL